RVGTQPQDVDRAGTVVSGGGLRDAPDEVEQADVADLERLDGVAFERQFDLEELRRDGGNGHFADHRHGDRNRHQRLQEVVALDTDGGAVLTEAEAGGIERRGDRGRRIARGDRAGGR